MWVSGTCLACVKCWCSPYHENEKGGRRAGGKEGRKGVSEPVWCKFVVLAAQDAEAGGLPSLWSAWARAIKDQLDNLERRGHRD